MTVSLQDDLADLTGEEVFHLISALDRCLAQIEAAPRHRALGEDDVQSMNRLWLDVNDCYQIALAQIARITIPIREAAALIYRARYSRNHPVRVPGT